jgi:hypothetical protein
MQRRRRRIDEGLGGSRLQGDCESQRGKAEQSFCHKCGYALERFFIPRPMTNADRQKVWAVMSDVQSVNLFMRGKIFTAKPAPTEKPAVGENTRR